MKTLTKEIVGFKVTIPGVAETLAELIEACGGEDRVVDMCNAHILAHSHYGTLRTKIAGVVAEGTGLERGEKETVQQFIARSDEDFEGGTSQFAEQVETMSAETPVNYEVKQRGDGSSAAPAKKYLAAVDSLIENERYEEFLDRWDLREDGLESDSDEQKAIAAHKVREILREQEKNALAGL